MHFQTEDGQMSDTAYMDAYSVGDRLLENVIFECKIEGDKIVPRVTEKCEKYFSTLNTKKWLEEIADSVNDIGFDSFFLDEACQIEADVIDN